MLQEKVKLYVESSEYNEEAKFIANKLKIDIIDGKDSINDDNLILNIGSNGLFLINKNMILHGDFTKNIKRLITGKIQSELLIKAAKIKGKKENLIAVDATAGLGEDSLLLATAGFKVYLYENNPIIALLLKDTIERAKKVSELEEIVCRMEVIEADSIKAMQELDSKPDVVLLDPMFPERKKSALVKKKFQLLHFIESPCTDEEEMLEAAILAKPHKIVIKRPLKGEWLANRKPDYSLKGKSIRYDCIVLNSNNILI